jgi:hypothetical protein
MRAANEPFDLLKKDMSDTSSFYARKRRQKVIIDAMLYGIGKPGNRQR